MANVFVEEQTLKDIADTIRSKLVSDEKYLPSDMPDKVEDVYNQGRSEGYNAGYDEGMNDAAPSGSVEITENGTHDVKDYAEAVVNVPTSGGEEQWNRLVVPRGVYSIPDNFSEENEHIETAALADDVITIGDWAFAGCYNLSSVNMPNSLRTIGEMAFDSSGLEGVLVFPSSLKSIEYLGFGYCWSLTEIIFNSLSMSIDDAAFEGCDNITKIKLPCSEDEAPAGAPWGAENAEIIYDWEE